MLKKKKKRTTTSNAKANKNSNSKKAKKTKVKTLKTTTTKNGSSKAEANKKQSVKAKENKKATLEAEANKKNNSLDKKETNEEKKKTRKRNKYGFAQTKKIPHANHPAFFKKEGSDQIDYVTFTHSEDVDIEGKNYKTIPLKGNINPTERKDKDKKSHVFPILYEGKRSALGEELKDFSFEFKEDKSKTMNLLETLPKKQVNYTSNSKKGKNKKKRSARSN